MYAKYRLYLQTTRGQYVMGASNRADTLPNTAKKWLEDTANGRSLDDDQLKTVILYQLDEDNGSYTFSERRPVTSRAGVVEAVKELTSLA